MQTLMGALAVRTEAVASGKPRAQAANARLICPVKAGKKKGPTVAGRAMEVLGEDA
ncbi:hypothetical protein H0274_10285 [Altererythrobacter sp. CC-YST694]|uniref:hypothetical protein n=1 Tax=Altererythrobacter sp. CC-YST694 TaxID=2755038 RepID=UPI001D02CC91|nr:hypothetical protein [Altererythrobacter sp. CC-YST694]MCB5425646.1 hypothetical protein [Altererythrobacter sp. CC-YST694]